MLSTNLVDVFVDLFDVDVTLRLSLNLFNSVIQLRVPLDLVGRAGGPLEDLRVMKLIRKQILLSLMEHRFSGARVVQPFCRCRFLREVPLEWTLDII